MSNFDGVFTSNRTLLKAFSSNVVNYKLINNYLWQLSSFITYFVQTERQLRQTV